MFNISNIKFLFAKKEGWKKFKKFLSNGVEKLISCSYKKTEEFSH